MQSDQLRAEAELRPVPFKRHCGSMEMTLKAEERKSIEDTLKKFARPQRLKLRTSSNYKKHGNFTVVVDEAWVFKFYSREYSFFEEMRSRIQRVLGTFNSPDFVLPELVEVNSTDAHRVIVWKYIPGRAATTLNWNEDAPKLMRVFEGALKFSKELSTLGSLFDPAVDVRYELSEAYEELFKESPEERWLTHGDLNLGNICLPGERIAFFDLDNISLQKKDLVLAQTTLFFLMAKGFEKYDAFREGFESASRVIDTVVPNRTRKELLSDMAKLARGKEPLSLDLERRRVWFDLAERCDRLLGDIT